MAKETKIGIKLEEETKSIKKMCEQLGESIKHEFDKGIEQINTEEMKEAIDMLKDLYEAKKSIVEACYYKQIMEAMEESEYGEDYDEEGPMERKYYRGQRRDSMGRFTSRGRGRSGRRGYEMIPMDEPYDEETWRQMDMMNGRMYFPQGGQSNSGGNTQGSNDGGNRGSYGSGNQGGGRSSSRYGYSHDEYMKEKQMNSGSDEMSKKKRMEKLEEYMDDLGSMAKEMVHDMSPEEKQMWKTKLNKLINM